MAALNIKSMNFGSNFLVGNIDEDKGILKANRIPILLDLAFASNVRYLDETEMYMNNVELYTTLPYASGVAMARGILDSLMSATYFNASALRLLRQLVTGGASFELEKSLAEGAGLRGGYSTPETLVSQLWRQITTDWPPQAARNRVRVETLILKTSQWSKFAQYGARFSDLYSATLRDAGLLCLAIYRRADTEDGDTEEDQEEEEIEGSSEKVSPTLSYFQLQIYLVLLSVSSP